MSNKPQQPTTSPPSDPRGKPPSTQEHGRPPSEVKTGTRRPPGQ
jgi:hypothetical protein